MQMRMEALRVFAVGILVGWALGVVGKEVTGLPSCHFPAIFNFGDSNSDTGGMSAAFYPMVWPFGETFFHEAVGRASDGRLMVDFIAEHLKLPYLSAYLDSLGSSLRHGRNFGVNFRHGANFATGGATILRPNKTLFESGVSPFYLDIQIAHFDQFKARTTSLYNHAKSAFQRRKLPRPEDFSKALYILDIGQNDISAGLSKKEEERQAYIPELVNKLSAAVQHLYEQGARAFWIHNTGPFGCLPVSILYAPNPQGTLDKCGCLKYSNGVAMEFNKQLKEAVVKLRADLPEAALTYVDIYAAKYALISDAKKQGFVEPPEKCCGKRVNGVDVQCGQKANVNGTEVHAASCKNPSSYISWDGVHYTEAANHWFANRIIMGLVSDNSIPIAQACHKAHHV